MGRSLEAMETILRGGDTGLSQDIAEGFIQRSRKLRATIAQRDWGAAEAKAARRDLGRRYPAYERALGGSTKPDPSAFPSAAD